MKKGIRKLTTWKMGDYVLQLSVVIVGVLVTFVVSDAVSSRAKAKEVAKAMEIMKNELEQNREDLAYVTEAIGLEQKACRYILNFENRLEEASPDSLQLYLSLPFRISKFNYTSDALEMLKASSLIQEVRDKELTLQILKAYNRLKAVREAVEWYNDMKEKYQSGFVNDPSFNIREDIKLKEEKEVCKIWKYRLGNIHVYNLVLFIVTGLPDIEKGLQDSQNILSQTVEMIDREYKR